jgi:RNA polymerase sigma factor (sigma-70 family)
MGSMYEDRVLVDKILNGNKSAFALLIKSHEKMVAYMVSRIILEEDEVKDVCQEVFIKVYLHLEKFKFDSKLSTWIATIAYRYALNHLKKRKKVSFSNLSDEVIIDYTQPVDTPL